jgi:hypothetical protein
MSPKYPPVLFHQPSGHQAPNESGDRAAAEQTFERQQLRQELLKMILKNEAQRYHRLATK